MNNNEGKSTAGAITERPIFVFIGMIPFLVRPMTLAQIWQIGEKIGDIEEINIEGEFNPYQKVFSMFKDVKNANEITPIIVFRSRLMRKIFGRFIRKRMTMKKYNELLQYASLSFDASFFFAKYNFPKRVQSDDNEYERSDSPWGLIGGVMKYFRMSYNEVVFKRSYINILLLNRAIPGIKPFDEEEGESPCKNQPTSKGGRKVLQTASQIKDNCNNFFMNLMN